MNIDSHEVFKCCYSLNKKSYQHNSYSLKNIELGKEGERMIKYFLEKFGLPVEGNNLDENYNNQRGADIVHKGISLYAEVKNNNGEYYHGPEFVRNQVLTRIPHKSRISLVFVAYDRFTNPAKQILRDNDIYIIEWGEQLTGQNWKKAISRLYKKFYPIYRRYQRLFDRYMIKVNSNSVSSIKLPTSTIHNNNLNILDNNILKDRWRMKKIKNWAELSGEKQNEVDGPRTKYKSWIEYKDKF